jgi:GTP-binding protein
VFVDKVSVTLRAGNGGDGVTSFRHEKFREKGGPDGGDGGDGGDVIMVGSRNQNTLAAFRYNKQLQAQHGQAGGKNKRHGKSASDLEVKVPVGTVVTAADGTILADLTADGQKEIIARGGKGGFGNAHFVSSTRQTPRVAEKGEKGEGVEATLELKMIADVGIVGLPNAGKSTLLSVISNARPEIADYPFTTLRPNLGVVDIDSNNSLLFADIPGLIEGASQGRGLGDEFLRHVERTRVLLHLVDVYNDDIADAYTTVNQELAAYDVDLSKRPQVVALTKIEGLDKKDIDSKIKQLKKLVKRGTPVLAFSSNSGQGTKELLRTVLKQADKATKAAKKDDKESGLPVIKLRPQDEAWHVQKTDKGFVVTGRKIERFANRTNFGDYHAEQRLYDIMRKMGIVRELERQGVEAEQPIIIGSPEIGRINY